MYETGNWYGRRVRPGAVGGCCGSGHDEEAGCGAHHDGLRAEGRDRDRSASLQNTAEKGPKTIGIVASTANLAPHVGHKIEITGVNVPAAEAEAMKPAPDEGRSLHEAERRQDGLGDLPVTITAIGLIAK